MLVYNFYHSSIMQDASENIQLLKRLHEQFIFDHDGGLVYHLVGIVFNGPIL